MTHLGYKGYKGYKGWRAWLGVSTLYKNPSCFSFLYQLYLTVWESNIQSNFLVLVAGTPLEDPTCWFYYGPGLEFPVTYRPWTIKGCGPLPYTITKTHFTILPKCTIPYHTIPYKTIPYHTIPKHTILYHTIPYLSLIHIWRCRRRG